MDITLEQAKAFDAIVNAGTVQKAAKQLNKGHSALMYLIKSLETQTRLNLFDRSGYRNQVSPEGEIVLKYCRQLLQTQNELDQMCNKLQSGWEPTLKLVYDGAINFDLIGDALLSLNKVQSPTDVKVTAAYLHEVEAKFEDDNADMMVTILPIHQEGISSIKLQPLNLVLVGNKEHPLVKNKNLKISELKRQTYIKIRGSTSQLGLSTDRMEFASSFLVNDFATKKQAICKGLGYGWLPEYLIKKELANKSLQKLNVEIENQHTFNPRLYHREEEFLGNTAKQLINHFKEI